MTGPAYVWVAIQAGSGAMKLTKKTNRILSAAILATATSLIVGSTAQAAITYVDATASNSTVNGNPMVLEPAGGYNIEVATSSVSFWRQRAFANGGTILAAPSSDTHTDVLNTSVTGLVAGTYRVYAYFWDQTVNAASEWDLAAQLNTGTTLDRYSGSATDVMIASSQTFTASVLTAEGGDRAMYAIDLGTFTGTGFTVNASQGTAGDALGGGVTDFRSWYDGVGYEFVAVPEPLILGLVEHREPAAASLSPCATGGLSVSELNVHHAAIF